MCGRFDLNTSNFLLRLTSKDLSYMIATILQSLGSFNFVAKASIISISRLVFLWSHQTFRSLDSFFFFCSAIDRPGLICLWFFTSGHTHYVLTTLNVTVDHFKFWRETAHLPLTQLNTYFSLRVKCWLSEGQGEQFPRNVNCPIVAPANISRKVMLHGTIRNDNF